MALAYITCKDRNEAEKISMHLLKKRLVACANIFPIKSMYWWKGKIVKDKEHAVIAKTKDNKFKRLVNETKRIHSYSIPCILRLDAVQNKEYEQWANKEIR